MNKLYTGLGCTIAPKPYLSLATPFRTSSDAQFLPIFSLQPRNWACLNQALFVGFKTHGPA